MKKWLGGPGFVPPSEIQASRDLSASCCVSVWQRNIATRLRCRSISRSLLAPSGSPVRCIPAAKTSMTDRVFVDTNVLVYSRDSTEVEKQRQALEWLSYLWKERGGRLSSQVLQEYYVTVTEKLKPGLDTAAARADVRSLLAWGPLPVDARTIEGAWAIQDRYALSWWDALIVSAAQIADCRYLLSKDLQDGQEFGGLRVINPFSNSPVSLTA